CRAWTRARRSPSTGLPAWSIASWKPPRARSAPTVHHIGRASFISQPSRRWRGASSTESRSVMARKLAHPPPQLKPSLEGRLAADRDRDMGEIRLGRGAVPVLLAGRNDHEVARPDADLFLFGGDDALALGDVEHLVEVMNVKHVHRALVEIDD